MQTHNMHTYILTYIYIYYSHKHSHVFEHWLLPASSTAHAQHMYFTENTANNIK